jgi:protein-S-isoprenylcysteine O-methyltransferase Ste14
MQLELFFQANLQSVLYYGFTALWLLEFIVFPNRFRGSVAERRSFLLILALVIVSIVLTIGLTNARIASYPSGLTQGIGLGLYALGLYLRYHGSIALGAYFTRHVEVSNEQQLISHGPYRHLRHPLYLGLYGLSLATPVYFGNPLAFMFALVSMGWILNRRMRNEEVLLEAQVPQYAAWKAHRYRFIPWIY